MTMTVLILATACAATSTSTVFFWIKLRHARAENTRKEVQLMYRNKKDARLAYQNGKRDGRKEASSLKAETAQMPL
jgi:hypothetical protein